MDEFDSTRVATGDGDYVASDIAEKGHRTNQQKVCLTEKEFNALEPGESKLGESKLGKVKLNESKLGKFKLGKFKLGKFKLDES